MRAILSRSLCCEPLETRDTPAGIVSAAVSGGVLTLTGDDADNFVSLVQTGTTIDVAGPNGTTITGGTSFPNVTALRAVLADGNDSLAIDNTAAFNLPGAVTVDLGDGQNALALSTNAKLDLGALTVTAGDGADLVTVAGGAGQASKITGNVNIALGIGADLQGPAGVNSAVYFQGLDLTGPAGLVLTAQDGDEALTLTDVRVTRGVTANGGEGSLDAFTTGSSFGALSLSSVGRQSGNPFDGTTLTATSTTIAGAVNLKSGAGARLEFTDGATGPVTVTAGPAGYTTNDFGGTVTVNGNVTVKGFRNSLTTVVGADVTVTGDVSVTSAYQSSLALMESVLRARNISVTGTGSGGADFYAPDFLAANTANLVVTGAMTVKGRTASYDQSGGQATFGTRLAVLATTDAYFNSQAAPFSFNAPGAKTTVTNGSLVVQGRDASFNQTESEVVTRTGVSVLATEDAEFITTERVQNEDPENAGVFDTAAGSVTRATAGKITVRGGTSAGYFQGEGDVSASAGLSVISDRGSASFSAYTGDGFLSVGPKTAVPAGGVVVQGHSASFDQTGGQFTSPAGVSVVGHDGAQFRVDIGETFDTNFDFFDVPAATTLAQGPLTLKGGAGEAQVSAFGTTLAVGGDLTISGQSHRVSFGSENGTTVGGKYAQTGATVEADYLTVENDFSVNGDMTVALGSGSNFIDLGDDGGTIAVGGRLSVTTGNGTDAVVLRNVTVTGTTTVTTGAGGDVLTILGASAFTGDVNVDLGGGADTLAVANEINMGGPVTFNGASRIRFGGGNDTVILGLAVGSGGDSNSQVVFAGSGFLNLDGGTNLNSFDDEAGQFDASNVTLVNFIDPNDL
jgi:hypothetical protein